MSDRTVVIAGGSGFLGVSLAFHLLKSDYKVAILSRNPPRADGDWDFVQWDARTLNGWQSVLDGADALVNLVGRTVAPIIVAFVPRVEGTEYGGARVDDYLRFLDQHL